MLLILGLHSDGVCTGAGGLRPWEGDEVAMWKYAVDYRTARL